MPPGPDGGFGAGACGHVRVRSSVRSASRSGTVFSPTCAVLATQSTVIITPGGVWDPGYLRSHSWTTLSDTQSAESSDQFVLPNESRISPVTLSNTVGVSTQRDMRTSQGEVFTSNLPEGDTVAFSMIHNSSAITGATLTPCRFAFGESPEYYTVRQAEKKRATGRPLGSCNDAH